jgi:hypothetical protein
MQRHDELPGNGYLPGLRHTVVHLGDHEGRRYEALRLTYDMRILPDSELDVVLGDNLGVSRVPDHIGIWNHVASVSGDWTL